MNPVHITLSGTEYPLATTLRVAYKVQGRFGHKPYMEVFKDFDSLKLEDQIAILFESFKLANPNSPISQLEFLNEVLDNFGVIKINEIAGDVIEHILFSGYTEEEIEQKKADARAKTVTEENRN